MIEPCFMKWRDNGISLNPCCLAKMSQSIVTSYYVVGIDFLLCIYKASADALHWNEPRRDLKNNPDFDKMMGWK